MNEFTANSPSHRHSRPALQDMIARRTGKITGRLVAVVADRAALASAMRLRRLPDYFELRLDALRDNLERYRHALSDLAAPLILTARHPAEGGQHALSSRARENLLLRFLDQARFVDVELRSVGELQPLIDAAKRRKVGLIISKHDLRQTPAPEILRDQLEAAIEGGADIFKIATRTDHSAQLDRLLEFFVANCARFPIAAMGMGKLGADSRRWLLRAGSALNYGALSQTNVPGQLTLRQLQRARAAYMM